MSTWIPRRTTHTRVLIRASSERVWDALADVAAYPRWNPLLKLRPWRGTDLREGGRAWLQLDLLPIPILIPVVIEVASPKRELCWRGGPPGLLRGRHYFELRTTLDGDETELIHGERFDGLLLPLLWPLMAPQLERLYTDVNAALADYVEG